MCVTSVRNWVCCCFVLPSKWDNFSATNPAFVVELVSDGIASVYTARARYFSATLSSAFNVSPSPDVKSSESILLSFPLSSSRTILLFTHCSFCYKQTMHRLVSMIFTKVSMVRTLILIPKAGFCTIENSNLNVIVPNVTRTIF